MRFSEDSLEKLYCSDGVDRDIHVWQPVEIRAVFLAVHGALAHGGDYVVPALYFKDKGIATVSYDMVGHDGKKRAHVSHFEQFLEDGELLLHWIKERYPDTPIFVMGHSMGGLISTYLGLQRFNGDSAIKGYVLSSPFYASAEKVPALRLFFARLLSRVLPKLKAPVNDFTNILTHDEEILQRHRNDEMDNIRGSELTIKFASELIKAKDKVLSLLPAWKHPLLVLVAGDDQLVDSDGVIEALKLVDSSLLEYHLYPDNYHENFNEVNRGEVFERISAWLEKHI